MNVKQLVGVFVTAVIGTVVGMTLREPVSSHLAPTVLAQGKSEFAPGHQSNDPSGVGNWFGVARPCPVTAGDEGHAEFCANVCPTCVGGGPLPPEVPMMPMIHADGTVTVNDAASIAVFHTTAQGVWAADPDPTQYQIPGRARLQASFIWLDGNPNHQFDGVVRPRFVTYFDPKNPDNMIGYIQPYFFPTNGNPFAPSPTMFTLPSGNRGGLNVTNHYPAVDFLAQLPKDCSPANGCLGTYHFTIHRLKANVPN